MRAEQQRQTGIGSPESAFKILRAAHLGAWNRLSTFEWEHVERIASTLTEDHARLIAAWLGRSNDMPTLANEPYVDSIQRLIETQHYHGSGRDARLALRCALLATNVPLSTGESHELDVLADHLLDDAWLVAGWIFRTRRPRVLLDASPNF